MTSVHRQQSVMSPVPRGPSTAWGWWITGGALLALLYLLAPLIGLAGQPQHYLLAAGGVGMTLAVLAGLASARPAHHRSAGNGPWLLLAAGVFGHAVAKLLTSVTLTVRPGAVADSVSGLADLCQLAQYPLLAGAMIALVRRRASGRQRGVLLDTVALVVAAGLLCWVYLVGPIASGPGGAGNAGPGGAGGVGGAGPGTAIDVLFPMLDLPLLAIALHLLAGAGRGSVALRLLAAGVLVLVGVDLLFAVEPQTGRLTALGWHAGASVVGYALLAAAALHPSRRFVAEPEPIRWAASSLRRVVVLGGAAAVPSAVLVVQHWRAAPIDAPAIGAAGAVLLVLLLVRLRGLSDQERASAITDPLTGLHGRGLVDELIRVGVGRAGLGRAGFGRAGFGPAGFGPAGFGRVGGDVGAEPELAVLLVDADHFGLINEAYGHAAGDRVLRELARRVSGAVGPAGVVGRDRDDRLIVVLPGVDGRAAARFAEDVRDRVCATPIELGEHNRVRLTVSIGFACLPADVAEPDELIQFAERALGTAKSTGRNRTAGRHGPIHPELLTRPR